MTDQEIIAQAIRQAQQILALQVAPGYRDPDEAECPLVDTLHRVEQGFGLRLVQ